MITKSVSTVESDGIMLLHSPIIINNFNPGTSFAFDKQHNLTKSSPNPIQ